MANVILFTDRAPRIRAPWTNGYYNYPAGAYKLASTLRAHGLKVLVVPNCLRLSAHCIEKIISNNSKGLLWIGLSTTFLSLRLDTFNDYRNAWHNSTDDMVDIEPLSKPIMSYSAPTEIAWGEGEVYRLAEFAQQQFGVPLLLGGAMVTYHRNGNLRNIHDNCYFVTGYAEDYVEKFTLKRMQDPTHVPPFLSDNGDYDDIGFKTSTLDWRAEDFVTPDAWLPLEIARGCAFNCSYCNYDKKARFDSYKEPRVIREELIRNYELYGVTKYILLDDLYNDSKEKVRRLYDEVWSKLPFTPEWTSYARLDMIWHDPESADIIKASGAKMCSFGIETLHERAGKKVGKGLGKKRILETLEILKEKWGDEVLINALMIAGLPYEPLESIQETMAWTASTDLLFSYVWAPLWITPNEHIEIVNPVALNDIAKNQDKFAVQWADKNIWINSEGVRFDTVDDLCTKIMTDAPVSATLSFSEYIDLRTAGLSHADIVLSRRSPEQGIKMIDAGKTKVEQLIQQRLQYVINVTD